MLLWLWCYLSCSAVWMWLWNMFTLPFSKYFCHQYLQVHQLWIGSIHCLWRNVFCSHWTAFKKKAFNHCKQIFLPFCLLRAKESIWVNKIWGGGFMVYQNTTRLLEQIHLSVNTIFWKRPSGVSSIVPLKSFSILQKLCLLYKTVGLQNCTGGCLSPPMTWWFSVVWPPCSPREQCLSEVSVPF